MSLHTSGHVDWLAVTMPPTFAPHLITPPPTLPERFIRKRAGYHGYEFLLETESGLTLQYGGSEAQGVHIVYPGQALQHVRDSGCSDRALVEHLASHGAKAARVDLALDLHGTSLTVESFADAWATGTLTTPSRTVQRFTQLTEPGDTLYLGARQSDRFMRIYDKRAESGVDGPSWLRLELQCRKLYARATLRALKADDTRAVVNTSIEALARTDGSLGDYALALLERSNDPITVPRRAPDDEKWLRQQVAPALARIILENPSWDVSSWLAEVVEQEISKRLARGGRTAVPVL